MKTTPSFTEGAAAHVLALLAHLNLGARGLDLSGLLVPDCRAALRAFVPGQIDLKLIAQRLERREQVAALIAVRRRLKVERLSVAVAPACCST